MRGCWADVWLAADYAASAQWPTATQATKRGYKCKRSKLVAGNVLARPAGGRTAAVTRNRLRTRQVLGPLQHNTLDAQLYTPVKRIPSLCGNLSLSLSLSLSPSLPLTLVPGHDCSVVLHIHKPIRISLKLNYWWILVTKRCPWHQDMAVLEILPPVQHKEDRFCCRPGSLQEYDDKFHTCRGSLARVIL